MRHATRVALAVSLVVVIAGISLAAGVKITTQEDKTFNFAGLKTYAWKLEGAAQIKILQNTDEDPAKIAAALEPVVVAAVDRELAKKGFTKVESGTPDLFVDYYALMGPNIESQYQGQFVGAVPAWGLPDFVMSTSSFKAYEQGSLIIDVISAKQQQIVWRVVAAAELDRSRATAKRVQLVSDTIVQMLKKFPPKFKK